MLRKKVKKSNNFQAIELPHIFRRIFRSSIWYKSIRTYFRAIAGIYHREIAVMGIENVPADGPLMMIGNHPNTMLDLFNLLTVIQHPMAAAAKETITDTLIIGPILRHKFNFIPLSRKSDQDESIDEETRQAKNKEYLAEAKNLIQQGMIFTIYGEGVSNDNRKLNKIKMGFMAMALDAEKEYNFNLNLQFVPFGYYYSAKNSFRTRVLVIFRPAFRLHNIFDLSALYDQHGQIDQRALKKLMLAGKNKMQEELEDIALSLPDESLAEIIDPICDLYTSTPHKYLGKFENIREKYFHIRKITHIVIDSYHKENKKMFETISQEIKNYFLDLKKNLLDDFTVANYYGKSRFFWYVLISFLATPLLPISLLGYLLNFIPKAFGALGRYFIVTRQKQQPVEGDMNAIIWGAVGCLVNYIPQGIAVGIFLGFFLFKYIGFWAVPSATIGALTWMYTSVQLWKFSLKLNEFYFDNLKIIFSHLRYFLNRKKVDLFKAKRSKLLLKVDQIIFQFTKTTNR